MGKVFNGNDKNIISFNINQTNEKPVNEKPLFENLKIEQIPTEKEVKESDYLSQKKDDLAKEIVQNVNNQIKADEKKYIYLKETFDEIEKIKKDAETKGNQTGLQNGQKEGYTKGYNEGKIAIEKELTQKYELQFKNLLQSVENMTLLREKSIEYAKKDAIELALIIAEKIIYAQIKLNPEIFINIVEESLKKMIFKNKITVFFNLDDFKLLNNIKFKFGNIETVISTDAKLKTGEIRIETDVENMSVSIDESINKVKEALKDIK